MGTYEYLCLDCKKRIESKTNDVTFCEFCKSENIKRIWNTNFILTGTGFYKTDSRGKTNDDAVHM